MRRSQMLVIGVLAACASAPAARSAAKPSAARTAAHDDAAAAQLSHSELAWITVRDLEDTANTIQSYLGDDPAALHTPALTKAALVSSIGIDPKIAAAVDGHGTLVVSLLDPDARGDKQAPPALFAIPVKSPKDFDAALAALYQREPDAAGPAGVSVFAIPKTPTKLYVTYQGDEAFVAFEPEVVRGAVALLDPRVHARGDTVVVHASPKLLAKLGDAFEQRAATFLSVSSTPGEPRNELDMRSLHRVAAYLSGASALEVHLAFAPGGLLMTWRLEGQRGDAWAKYVDGKKPATGWGAALLPADAVLAYTTRLSPSDRDADTDALEAYLTATAGANHDGKSDLALHDALRAALAPAGDELAQAVWPARGGGLGAGGAYRVSDPAAARRATGAVYAKLGAVLGRIAASQLSLDPMTYKFTSHTRTAAFTIDGVPVDVVELTPNFPKTAKGHTARARFEALFGDRLQLGTAYVSGPTGAIAVYAIGRDFRARLDPMIRAAQGQHTASIADSPDYARAVQAGGDRRVSLAYVSTAGLASLVQHVVARLAGTPGAPRDATAGQKEMLEPFLRPGREHTAIVIMTRVARVDGDRVAYELTSLVPAPALAELTRLGGAMWRVALSPILGSPPMPPMPMPPSDLTPPIEPESEAPAKTISK